MSKSWGDLQAWQPGARPRGVAWPEDESPDEPLRGITINMRQVRNANISDGNRRNWEERRKNELAEFKRLHREIDDY